MPKKKKNATRVRDAKGRFVKRSLTGVGGNTYVGVETNRLRLAPSSGLSTSGIFVDEITSLNLSSIWCGVNVIAGDLTKLSLNVYQHLANNKGKQPDWTHRNFRLLSYPNKYQTGRKLRLATNAHVVLFGQGFNEIVRDGDGVATELHLLDPRQVTCKRLEGGRLVYPLRTASPWSGKKTLLAENILHFTGLTLNGDTGISSIQTAAESLGTSIAVERFGGSLFGNGAVPQGLIETPPGWDELARENFRESWQDRHGGVGNANNVAILEEGAKWVATSFNPEQLQLLSIRQFTVVEVARILGVPPSKLQDFSHDVQRSLEESNRDYYETSLLPQCRMIEDELSFKLFTEAERSVFFFEHNMNSLMRPSALERAQTNEIKMRNGVILINEWRAEDGRNPFEEDGRVMPLNMTLVKDGADLEPAPEEGDPSADTQPQDNDNQNNNQVENDNDNQVDITREARSLLTDTVGKFVRREIKNLRKGARRAEYGADWLDAFYAKEEPVILDALSSPLRLYGKTRGRTLDPVGIVSGIVQRSRQALGDAKDVETLLTAWENTKAEEIIASMEGE